MCLPWFTRTTKLKSKRNGHGPHSPIQGDSERPSEPDTLPFATTSSPPPLLPASEKPATNGAVQSANATTTKKSNNATTSNSKHPPFSAQRAAELFQSYRDHDVTDTELIGPEGLEKVCLEAQLDMEGVKPVILAWVFGGTEMARFLKSEWTDGASKWQYVASSLAAALNELTCDSELIHHQRSHDV
jgi:hypothetical protein